MLHQESISPSFANAVGAESPQTPDSGTSMTATIVDQRGISPIRPPLTSNSASTIQSATVRKKLAIASLKAASPRPSAVAAIIKRI